MISGWIKAETKPYKLYTRMLIEKPSLSYLISEEELKDTFEYIYEDVYRKDGYLYKIVDSFLR